MYTTYTKDLPSLTNFAREDNKQPKIAALIFFSEPVS